MAKRQLRIGTRASQLALWQANWVRSELVKRYPDLEVTLVKIKTTGDKILDVPLARVGGKGLFTKEIEEAMLNGEIEVAVHSMKDVPTFFPQGLALRCITEREDPRDAFVSVNYERLEDLPEGSVVGTSSLRRAAQILSLRPDIRTQPLRGNVDTRLRKVMDGQYDAIIIAGAGLTRLGLEQHVTEWLSLDVMLPAPGQGGCGTPQHRPPRPALLHARPDWQEDPPQAKIQLTRLRLTQRAQ